MARVVGTREAGPEAAADADGPRVAAGAAGSMQSVERAVTLLRLFVPGRPPLSLTEIAQLTGWSASTAHRYCTALRSLGLLRLDADDARYALGGACLELGWAAANGLPVVRAARPFLDELITRVGMSAVIGVLQEDHVRVAEVQNPTSGSTIVSVFPGAMLPLFTTAQGQVFLAHSPDLRRRFARRPEMDRLEAVTTQVREDGWALETQPNGAVAAAAPIFYAEHVVAAVALIGTPRTLPSAEDARRSRVIVHLVEAAQRISRALRDEA